MVRSVNGVIDFVEHKLFQLKMVAPRSYVILWMVWMSKVMYFSLNLQLKKKKWNFKNVTITIEQFMMVITMMFIFELSFVCMYVYIEQFPFTIHRRALFLFQLSIVWLIRLTKAIQNRIEFSFPVSNISNSQNTIHDEMIFPSVKWCIRFQSTRNNVYLLLLRK